MFALHFINENQLIVKFYFNFYLQWLIVLISKSYLNKWEILNWMSFKNNLLVKSIITVKMIYLVGMYVKLLNMFIDVIKNIEMNQHCFGCNKMSKMFTIFTLLPFFTFEQFHSYWWLEFKIIIWCNFKFNSVLIP